MWNGSMTKPVRDPRANYAQSLMQLRRAKAASVDAPSPILTKTSLMLGLGRRAMNYEDRPISALMGWTS